MSSMTMEERATEAYRQWQIENPGAAKVGDDFWRRLVEGGAPEEMATNIADALQKAKREATEAPPSRGGQLWEQVRDLQLALNTERGKGREVRAALCAENDNLRCRLEAALQDRERYARELTASEDRRGAMEEERDALKRNERLVAELAEVHGDLADLDVSHSELACQLSTAKAERIDALAALERLLAAVDAAVSRVRSDAGDEFDDATQAARDLLGRKRGKQP